jgi:glucose-1-phosphate thymidylyltransferase
VKALVLAGGAGTRLRPITHTSAKQLVPVANRPVLFYALDAVAAAGIQDVGIVVGETEDEIRAAVGDGSAFGLRVTYLRQPAPLGLAHAVLVARDWLGDAPFVMYLGDNVLVGGITALVAEFEEAYGRGAVDATILLTRVPDPSQFGVAELDPDGHVVRLVEKPSHPRSDLALAGVYLFGPAVHDAVTAISPSARGELEITDAIQQLVDTGRAVRSHVVTGYWKDTGRVEDLLDANRTMLDLLEPAVDGDVDAGSTVSGAVVVEKGAVVEASELVGPAVVGAGSTVRRARVGPYASVGPGCSIQDTVLTDSIVLTGTTVSGGHLAACLLGREVEVVLADSDGPYRLVLGDHSTVRTTGGTT